MARVIGGSGLSLVLVAALLAAAATATVRISNQGAATRHRHESVRSQAQQREGWYFTSGGAEAIKLYVATNGTDAPSNNGTSAASPLASVERALDIISTMRNGGIPEEPTTPVRIVVSSGLYRLNRTLTFTADLSRVGIESASLPEPSADPVILSGGDELTLTADPARPGEFVGVLPPNVDAGHLFSVFSSSQGAWTRRFMNSWCQDEYCRYESFDTKLSPVRFQVTADDAAALSCTENLENSFAYVYHSWTSSIGSVQQFNTTTRELSFKNQMPDNVFNSCAGNRFRLVNARRCNASSLAPGAYIVSPSDRTIRYRPAANDRVSAATGSSSASVSLMIPRLPTLLSVKDASELFFFGLQFSFAADDIASSCLATGCDGQSASALLTAALDLNGANRVQILHSNVLHNNAHGIRIYGGSQIVSVEVVRVHDMGAGGIRIGENAGGEAANVSLVSSQNAVYNCNVSSGGHIVESGAGILVQQAIDTVLVQNDIFDHYYTGISLGWTWTYSPTSNRGNSARMNRIFNIGKKRLCDMGCIYTLGHSPESAVDGNVCFDVQTYGYGGNGLYTDQASAGYIFTNNIVYGTKNALLLQHFGINNTFSNNVFADPVQDELAIDASNGVFSGIRSAQASSGWEGISSFTFVHNVVLLNNASAAMLLGSYDSAFKNMTLSHNCYFNSAIDADALQFPTWGGLNRSFAAWKSLGKDADSLVADPQFEPSANPRTRYNKLAAASQCLSVFTPIDSSQAGSFWSPPLA